jgi:uncharacterized protein (UPF0248 family)
VIVRRTGNPYAVDVVWNDALPLHYIVEVVSSTMENHRVEPHSVKEAQTKS